MNRTSRRVIGSLALLATLGCGDTGTSSPSPNEFLPRFGLPRKLAEESGTERPEIRLYLDRSKSMRGFVEPRSSKYRQVLNLLLDRAAVSHCPFRAFGFADDVEVLSSGSQPAETPSFYAGLHTDLRHLFVDAAPRIGAVSIVVSDFVQSADGDDQRALAAAVDGRDAAEWQVALLGFRSTFHGSYFVERPGATARVFPLDLDGATASAGRPFYLLVLARRRRDLDAVRRLLLADLKPDQELDPSEPALQVADVQLAPDGPATAEEESRWSRSQQLEGDLRGAAGPYARVNSFIALGEDSERLPPLRLAVTASPRTPLRSISDLEIARSAKERRGGRWRDAPAFDARADWAPAPKVSKGGESPASGGEASFVLTLPLPRPADATYAIYRARVMPGQGNLLPPLWVESWTTDDDSTKDYGNRTFKLRLLVDVLIRSIQERVPILDEFILVRRAE